MTMSNLTPTPRTDKNGRTVIRYMKDRFAWDRKTATAIPAVIQPQNGNDHKRVGNLVREYLLELPNLHAPIPSSEEFSSAMSKLNESTPEALTTIERLMSEGTDNGRKAVALFLMEEVKMVKYGVSDIVEHPTRLKPRLLELWNGENVADEAGLSGELDFRKRSTLTMVPVEKFGDAEWRGHAAFRLAFETTEAKPSLGSENLMGFIHWAGREKDVAKVIEFARERRTMDPSTIKPLMENPESDSVLRGGLL